jgi:hypothetical protein
LATAGSSLAKIRGRRVKELKDPTGSNKSRENKSKKFDVLPNKLGIRDIGSFTDSEI